jgi:FkbM family methyltransferase
MKWIHHLKTLLRALRYRLSAERAELRFMLGRRLQGGSVLDIGAHRGEYTYWMHQHFGGDTRVVAFEPQPELAKYLSDFTHDMHLDRVEVAPVGLSSHSGNLRMHRPRKSWEAATVDDYFEDGVDTDVFDVEVTTIDEYVAAHPELRPVKFIKCDVEFHEADVLAGAEKTLREDRPELIVEWSTPRRAYRERLFKLAQKLGYSLFQFEYGHLKPCTTAERHSPPSWELGANYVLLPREAAVAGAT